MKIYEYIAIASLAAAATACNLDEFPKDKLAPENYFNTEQELASYTNTFYQQNLPDAATVYSETADAVICITLQEEVAGTRVLVNKGGGWDAGSWNPLTYINTYLHYSHRCPNEKVRAQYDGVARFFRAYFYFNKVKRFGDVPWYDDIVGSDSELLYKERDSREFVMQKILEDLDYAIANLPKGQDVYNVTSWTALALKSRVCLFEGTYRKYQGISGYEKYLEACADASDRFISSSPYTIWNGSEQPYRDLFSSENATSTMTEVILARDYDRKMNVVHNANFYTLNSSYGQPGVNKKIVDSYLMADGTRFTDRPGWDKMGFFEETRDRDPRLYQTVRCPGYTRIGSDEVLGPDFNCSTTGYNLTKWVTDIKQDGYNNSYNDIILFRAAEVYLNYAEAKAELGTLTQADLDRSIKPIRARVGMPALDMAEANANPDPYLSSSATGYVNVSGSNKGVILEIRRERTIELLDEGHRYYDMVRWHEGKRFEEQIKGMYFAPFEAGKDYRVYDMDGNGMDNSLDICLYSGAIPDVPGVVAYYKVGEKFRLTGDNGGNIILHDIKDEPRTWNEERDYLYPIPLSQILLGKGNLTQNPGWGE